MGSGTGCPNAPEMRRLNWWVEIHRIHDIYHILVVEQGLQCRMTLEDR